jgi:hypothetical protein
LTRHIVRGGKPTKGFVPFLAYYLTDIGLIHRIDSLPCVSLGGTNVGHAVQDITQLSVVLLDTALQNTSKLAKSVICSI